MIEKDVSLSQYTNYQIGGPAKYFLKVSSLAELKVGLLEWSKIENQTKEILVIGKGTNILVKDDGFNGLVILNKINYINKFENDESDELEVGSGLSVEELNNYTIENSLSGLEWSGGLPGTVGGGVFGNAGAFGGEFKDNVKSVKSLPACWRGGNLKTLEIIERNNNECEFGYRDSVFKKNSGQEIIISVTFKIKKGNSIEIKNAIDEKIIYRKDRQPLDLPSAGSVFKNIEIESVSEDVLNKFRDKVKNDPFPIIPVAAILADAQIFGLTVGGAKVSEKHPNFIVNTGGATSKDVLELISKIKNIIKEKYKIHIETEIVIV